MLKFFLSRRELLKSAATSAAISPVAAVASEPEVPARERIDNLVAELKAAVMEVNPAVRFTDVSVSLDEPRRRLPVLIMAQWASGNYEGDGIYEGKPEPWGTEHYEVKMLDQLINGERGFSVVRVGEKDRNKWMRLSESNFEAFIGQKVASTGSSA